MSIAPNPFVKPEAYAGACVVCLGGTDTGLIFAGEPEWLAAGLAHLGIAMPVAISMVEKFATPVDENDHTEAAFRVCTSCVSKTNFPAPALLINEGSIPCIQQPA